MSRLAFGEIRSIIPSEGVLFRGDVGIAQMCYGLSSPSQLAAISILDEGNTSTTANAEPVKFDWIENMAKKKYKDYDSGDVSLDAWMYSYLAYFFSRGIAVSGRFGGGSKRKSLGTQALVVATSLGNVTAQESFEPFEQSAQINHIFGRVDRIRMVAALSTEDRISLSEFRKEVTAPGSLDHNIRILEGKKVLKRFDQGGNAFVEPSGSFDIYLHELEKLQKLVAEAAEKELREGMTLEARHLMNADFISASPFDPLSYVLYRMVFLEAIHGIVISSPSGHLILERDGALRASAKGIPGSTRIQSTEMKEYMKAPCYVNLDDKVSEVARKMAKDGMELAIVRKSKEDNTPCGIISAKDLLMLNSYHDRPFKMTAT